MVSTTRPSLRPIHLTHRLRLPLLLAVAIGLAATGAYAQPFDTYLRFDAGYPSNSAYISVPNAAALNPTAAFTFEAWVRLVNSSSTEDCRSIAGKNYTQAWWIGLCTVGGQPTLRSFLKGGGSLKNGGYLERDVWTHIAVTFNGSERKHYINGELAATFPETGPLTTSTSPVRIGSDVLWERTPDGRIDEVRLWNVARSQSQLRASINVRLTTPQTGLIALWRLNGNGNDATGAYNGSLVGTNTSWVVFPFGGGCVNSADAFCQQGRFLISPYFRTATAHGPVTGPAHVVGGATGSTVFWFFGADNWELMLKTINGCGLNSRKWVYFAATTDRFFRIEVWDTATGEQKIYFSYPGVPAPAVTDSDALATCP
jgi:hypothetical protein